MDNNSSPDYKALFLQEKAFRRQAEEERQRAEENQEQERKGREQAEREREDAEDRQKQAEEGERQEKERNRQTTFGEFIQHCHNLLSQPLKVKTPVSLHNRLYTTANGEILSDASLPVGGLSSQTTRGLRRCRVATYSQQGRVLHNYLHPLLHWKIIVDDLLSR